MSLNTTVVNAVNKAFLAAGDLVGDFTLRKVTDTFDPSTSITTTINVDTVSKGVLDSESSGYMDRDNLTNKYITLWLKTTVIPEVNDILIDIDANKRKIIEVNSIRSYNTVFLYELKLTS